MRSASLSPPATVGRANGIGSSDRVETMNRDVLRYHCTNPFVVVDNRMSFFLFCATSSTLQFAFRYTYIVYIFYFKVISSSLHIFLFIYKITNKKNKEKKNVVSKVINTF